MITLPDFSPGAFVQRIRDSDGGKVNSRFETEESPKNRLKGFKKGEIAIMSYFARFLQ